MAWALPRCIWFTDTEFVFNKKQTFQKQTDHFEKRSVQRLPANSVDGSTFIFLIKALQKSIDTFCQNYFPCDY